MVASTLEPAVIESSGGWPLPPWFAVIVRKLRRALLSEEENRLLHLVEYATSTFGAGVLAAESLDDLDDRIDAVLARPDLRDLLNLTTRALTTDTLDRARPTEPNELETELFGLGNAALLREALSLSAHTVDVVARSLRAHGVEAVLRATHELFGDKPLAFLADPRLPPEVGLAMLGGLKATVCSLAMAEALRTERKLKPWLSRAILERWVEGQRGHLRLLASFSGMDVPEHVVPLAERLDVERIERDHAEAQARLSRLAAEARELGSAVYPNAVEPGDDD